MKFKLLYSYETQKGTFYIGQSTDGRFHSVFDDESYGSYEHPWQAAEDLAGGCSFSFSDIQDTSPLGLPEDLNEWQRLA